MARSATRIAALIVLVTACGPVSAAEVPDRVETRVGQRTMLKLPGNPKAGFKWRFNAKQSSGLELVRVKQVGWIMAPERTSFLFGQLPSVLNVSIEALAAGEANLAFDYFRNWSNRTWLKTSTIRVVIKPAAAPASRQ